ncbi:MAG: TatD family hydrolase [Polyangiaceae bacterium]
MGLFDVHAHLTHPQFAVDLPSVLLRARERGVTTIISNGLNLEDNRAVLELARSETLVRPALGLYPVDAVLPEMRAAGVEYPREGDEYPAEECIAFIREHLDEAFAVGEVGLDGYWVPEAFWGSQEVVFLKLVEIAREADKPLIVHTRKREKRCFELLSEYAPGRVLWHCFGSKLKLAEQIAAAGHYLSIPCNAQRSEGFTRMLEKLPRSQLLLETDCPYLGPVAGERNEPANVQGTLMYAASLWKVSPEGALAIFEENFERLFGVAP